MKNNERKREREREKKKKKKKRANKFECKARKTERKAHSVLTLPPTYATHCEIRVE